MNNTTTAVSNETGARENPAGPTGVSRRQLGIAVMAVLAGGLGMAKTAQAFPRGSGGAFSAASRILAPYGVSVDGDVRGSHDVLGFEIDPLPATEYDQTIGTRNRVGRMIPSINTQVFEDNARFTHFHPGEIVPCVRTSIQGHSLATHELFDSDQGGLEPCLKVESEMLEGGHIGTITATHFHDGAIVPCIKTTIEGHSLAKYEVFDAADGDIVPCVRVASEMLKGGVLGAVEITLDDDLTDFRLVVGSNTYTLVGGALVLVPR